ncbi:UNVERIFIED_CONTAM: hypothetical protein RKD43_000429 [Streptomyces graminofaciens]
MDGLAGPLLEPELSDHLRHPGLPLRPFGVLGEAQLRGVGEGAADGQLGVQDVVLRHESDAPAQLGVVAVEVAPVVQDGSPLRGPQPGERVQQGGLSRAARPDHGEQALLADGEGDVVQEGLAAPVHGDRQVLHVERDLAGVDELLELVTDQHERGVPHADDVACPHRRPVDGRAVEVGAVVAAEVDDLVRAVGPGAQFRVPPGDHQVVDD